MVDKINRMVAGLLGLTASQWTYRGYSGFQHDDNACTEYRCVLCGSTIHMVTSCLGKTMDPIMFTRVNGYGGHSIILHGDCSEFQ